MSYGRLQQVYQMLDGIHTNSFQKPWLIIILLIHYLFCFFCGPFMVSTYPWMNTDYGHTVLRTRVSSVIVVAAGSVAFSALQTGSRGILYLGQMRCIFFPVSSGSTQEQQSSGSTSNCLCMSELRILYLQRKRLRSFLCRPPSLHSHMRE